MKRSRLALFQSFISLLLCFSMLIGTTFAWFTDGVSNTNNVIASGSLDVELEYLDDSGTWKSVNEQTSVLDKEALWEPGHTEVAYLKISNLGDLALKYGFGVRVVGETGSVNAAGDAFNLSDYIRFGVIPSKIQQTYTDRNQAREALTDTKLIKEGYVGGSTLYPKNSGEDKTSETYITLVVYMPEDVGNAANYATGQNIPEIQLGIELVATQAEYEGDSFGSDYDFGAEVPGFSFPDTLFGDNASAGVTTNGENIVAEDVIIEGTNTNALIPAGVQLEDGVEELTLAVSSMSRSEANISLGENEKMRSLDVHVQGVSAENTQPMKITLKGAAAKGLNAGNLKLYHVENGETVEMYLVNTFTAHNQFKYDPATGDITLYMATFSEVAVVADTENLWNGTIAGNFAGGSGTAEDPYIIANADQLAHMNQEISYGSGNEAHYKLIADVNIGGKENYSKNGVIWYPIGYTKDGSAATRSSLDAIFFEPISAAKPGSKDGDVVAAVGDDSWYTYGGSFRGVFDGNNHKITGIYQNTWAMRGDYDGHYYNDAMGLFGYVNGGTVKNLTIDNFYSEGEFAPTGCVTAYAGGSATFENIAITNSHPQTYNTGVAGIVGWDNGNSSDFTFKNITVDSSNTVSALWGSWDVAAAGILGCLKNGSKADFENCHVSATIDVYNDVCGNYQYYWYRYCGAFIGTVYKRLDNGQGALDLSDVTAKNCTVNFGNRHEYYYCEFEKNTQASYTEDYQFSRVPHSELNMNDNPVTCNHDHTANEDKQAVYIPFYQLFGGYGWGVQGLDLDAYKSLDIAADKKGIEKDETEKSVQKFAARVADYSPYLTNTSVTIGELFNAVNNVHPAIDVDNVQVTISPVGETSTAGGTYTANTSDWTKGTLFFTGEGDAQIIITDYHYCEPTSLKVTVRKPAEKFEAKVDINTVIETGTTKTIDEMFNPVEGADVKNNGIKITVETVEGNANGSYTANAEDWKQGKVEFSGEGVVRIGITDDNFCETTYTEVTIKAPVDKFERNSNAPAYIEKDSAVTIDELFSEVSGVEPAIDADSIEVKVTAADGSDVSGTYVRGDTDWTKGVLTFSGEGVAKITITDNHFCNIASADVTITGRVHKFAVKDGAKSSFEAGTDIVTIGDLFSAVEGVRPELNVAKIQVTVTSVGEESDVGGEFTPDANDWTQGTLTFTGKGAALIRITDDYICEDTTLDVTVTERQPVEKFEVVFKNTEKYTYRVGNQNTVALSSLFAEAEKENVQIGVVNAAFETISGSATGTYSENADWKKGTIQFNGTGKVKVTITDNDYCIATELTLEVVNAMNATSAASATKNNVVLLNDVGLHNIEVSGGYTLYGNGFKMTATNDVMYDAMGVGFVTLKNGTLDNVQIICPNFSYAVVYNSNIKDSANTATPSDTSNDARGNVRSAVMADGNSYILDSYVHGGRAAIFLRSGNLVVDNSTISGGAAANIHTVSAQSLTLRDATLIQKPFQATVHDTTKTIMGFSGLFECDENGNSTPLVLEGTLVQNAWINESYKQYVPSAATSIVNTALSKADYLHDLNSDGTKESLNLGFTYIPQSTGGSTNANVTDNRANKDSVPYAAVDVGNAIASAKVYSYKNTSGTEKDFIEEQEGYTPTTQGSVTPTLSFTDTNADCVFETKFDTSDNRWESTLTVNLDKGDYTFSFDKLLAQRNGENLDYTVKTADGTAVDISKPIALTASGVTTYEITVTPKTRSMELVTCYFNLVATKTSIPEPEVADTTGGTPLLVVKSKGGDWSCAIPALDGIKIKYYTVDGEVVLDLATLTPTGTGKQNGTNNFWETSKDGYKLKVSCGYIHDTKQIYGMPIVVNNSGNKMYFTISSTNGYVSTSTSGRTVTLTYEFTDPNGKTLKFSKTWQFNYADYKNGKQYSYSDFVNGTLKEASSSCVSSDTLVTLADGTQKRIDAVTYSDQLLVWDFFKGDYAAVPAAILFDHGYGNNTVIKLNFSDGTTVKVVNLHQFFDTDLNKFVNIDEETVDQYVGHSFAKQGGKTVKLVDYTVSQEYVEAYGIISALHYNIFVEGMMSTDFMPEDYDLFNYFEVGKNMTYDAEAMKEDIETYGLYTYADFADYLTEEQFAAFNVQYFKIPVGKGEYTYEGILALINEYLNQ